MTAWTRDGVTRQDLFRGCNHQAKDGRCVHCRAKAWEGFVQQRQPGSGLGAIPIGSPYLMPPKIGDMTNHRTVSEHPGVFMPVKKWDKEAA